MGKSPKRGRGTEDEEAGVSSGFRIRSKIEIAPQVKQLYKVIQKSTGGVGGYGHDGPVYGEITEGSFQKIVNFMKDNVNFGTDSSFMDIGAGWLTCFHFLNLLLCISASFRLHCRIGQTKHACQAGPRSQGLLFYCYFML